MKYVYILRSVGHRDQRYIGITTNLKKRLRSHNDGSSRYTKKYRPWIIEIYIGFNNERKAEEFERYLKSGSGREFARRHFRIE